MRAIETEVRKCLYTSGQYSISDVWLLFKTQSDEVTQAGLELTTYQSLLQTLGSHMALPCLAQHFDFELKL